ncbi:MAG: 2-oxo acid dehydrogenase subunit E2, partial [Streptomycetaceae bacterium]|nr:2-oxo acid dehydrogenase subunit E2 [Streptomycetaceae bacterium]
MSVVTEIRLPHMGVVERAIVTGWHKKVGDSVAIDEPLCDVSTDKVETEIPATGEGRIIKLLAAEGDEIPVGAVLALVVPEGTSDADIATALGGPTPAAQEPLDEPVSPPDAGPEGPSTAAPGRVPSSPLARRVAAEAGVDLAELAAANPGRRIRRADVEAAAKARKAAAAAQKRAVSQAPVPTDTARPPTATTPASPPIAATDERVPRGYEAVPHELIAHTPTRRAIAEHMVRSVSTAPQLTAQVDIDMSQVGRVRAEVNALRTSQGKGKLSYLVFITRALVATVAEHPDINATFTDTHLVRWQPVNVGIAADTPSGLVVPVVHNAERLNLSGLAESISDITTRAADRSLTAEDLTGGTITSSNAGSVGDVVIA